MSATSRYDVGLGVNTIIVPGSSAGVLETAKAGAITGKTIFVSPGEYSGTNLLKNGVSWDFATGAVLTDVRTTEGSTFDDSPTGANGAIVGMIGGMGELVYDGTYDNEEGTGEKCNVLFLTNTGSNLTVQCTELRNERDVEFTRQSQSTVRQTAGTLHLTAERILTNCGSAIWWDDGPCWVNAQRIEATDATDGVGGVYVSLPDTASTGDLYVTAQLITAAGGAAITVIPTAIGNASRVWIDCLDIRAGGRGIDVQAGFVYVTGQRLRAGNIAVNMVAGELWLTVQKVLVDMSGGRGLYLQGGESHLQFEDVEEIATGANRMIECTGGTHIIKGMRWVGGASTAGILVSGGTLILENCYINTSANAGTSPISKSGGTIILDGCTLIAEGTQDSITASTAQNVKIYGTTFANKTVNVNVTIQVGTLVVGASVT